MKTLELTSMEQVQGGKPVGLCRGAGFTCGLGAMFLEISFACPVLFAFTAPLTVGACTASAMCAGL